MSTSVPSAGPSILVPSRATHAAPKRVLSDSEDISDREKGQEREPKRARRGSIIADAEHRGDPKEKEKRKRRKKKRKQPIIASQNMIHDIEGLTSAAASVQGEVASDPLAFLQHRNPPGGESSRVMPVATTVAGSSRPGGRRQPSEGPSSVTLGTESPEVPPKLHLMSSDSVKGKGRASPKEELLTEESSSAGALTLLTTQLTTKTDLLGRHIALISALQQSLTCQICLDPMHRPYALAPCGHTACHTCLVSWFRAPPPDIPPDQVLPAALRKKTCPHCRAVVTERPVEVWAVKEMVSVFIKSGLADPPMNAPNATTDPSTANANADPWEGIFRKAYSAAGIYGGHEALFFPDPPPPAMLHQVVGILDHEDGGVYRCVDCMHEIWDGVCSSCGRLYPGHAHAPHAHLDAEENGGHGDPQWDEEDEGGENGDWIGMGPLGGFMWDAFGWDYDDDDTEIDDESVDGSFGHTDVSEEEPPPRVGRRRYSPVHEAADEHGQRHSQDESEEDGGYESSFIDDEDDHGLPHPFRAASLNAPNVWASAREEHGNEEDEGEEEIRLASRPTRRIVRRQYVDADDSSHSSVDDDDIPIPGPSTRRSRLQAGLRGGHRLIYSDDEEGIEVDPGGILPNREDSSTHRQSTMFYESGEEDAESQSEYVEEAGGHSNLAAEVAARERELYGDDGSVPRQHSGDLYELATDGAPEGASDEESRWEEEEYSPHFHELHVDDDDHYGELSDYEY